MSGAVTIPAEIGGSSYKLVFKFGTIRLAEKELPASLAETFTGGGVTLDALSAVFWAALQPHHAMAREKSDDLIDVAGIDAVTAWIGEGVGRYFGGDDADPDPVAEGNGRPKKRGKSPAS